MQDNSFIKFEWTLTNINMNDSGQYVQRYTGPT